MNSAKDSSTIQKPFIEHVYELRKRLVWIVFFVSLFSGLAYSVHQQILNLLQKPLGQTLYYTSPTGGFSFLFKVCLVAGFVMALPVILYHLFEFLGPLLHRKTRFVIIKYTFCSFVLAYLGILFAYFVSLPAALHFLTKIGGSGIKSLIGVDEYFNFALAYVGGFALLFQLPLVVLFINRIKPLSPKKMMSAERYLIVIGFIVAAILTPTPDPLNQTIMALPIILLYQFSIIMVWLVNRKAARKTSTGRTAAGLNETSVSAATQPTQAAHEPTAALVGQPVQLPARPASARPGKYIDGIRPGRRTRYNQPVARRPVSPPGRTIHASPSRRFISDVLVRPSPARQ